MATISLHVDDAVEIGEITPAGAAEGWPLTIEIKAYCGEGNRRQIYDRDRVHLHGKVADFRRFAEAILAALPATEPICTEYEMISADVERSIAEDH